MSDCLGRTLMDAPVDGETIESMSFAAIEAEGVRGALDDAEWTVARRLVHASGDPGIVRALRFSGDWLEEGLRLVRKGAGVYCDASMARSGISAARLRAASGVEPDIRCHVADPDVARRSRESGLPRSVWAVRKAAPDLQDGIWLFGNAPTGLMELVRLHLEEGFRPGLVLAMPVGFVHVVESKREFLGTSLPGLSLAGRRGGSPLVVAALHALCTLAQERP